MNTKIDIIIPSFNGKHLLAANLPNIIKNTTDLGEIIVIDNGSQDGTLAWLNANYPKIRVIVNQSNLGYTIPINQGVSISNSKFFVLLNNDVSPKQHYLNSPLKYLSSPNIFAITFNEVDSSWPNTLWENGKMQYSRGTDKGKPVYSAWASGGSAIFNRQIWEKLGGYDSIYSPWYWEDIDIGYRAWKSGYKIIWDPSSKVVHNHESTSKNLNQKYVNLIKQRNELLFNWLNITDKNYKFEHFKYLLKYTLNHPGYLKIILSAIFRILTHPNLKRNFSQTDKEVISNFSKSL